MSYLGIDAGGTWVKGARFDASLREEGHCRISSGASESMEKYFASIEQAVRECTDEVVERVGIAVPGIFDPRRRYLLFGANVVGLNGSDMQPVDMVVALRHAGIERPFVMENDANCAALAEWQLGEGGGDGSTRLLHITWGTGIGTGFVADGSVHYGWEAGHIPLTFSYEPTPDNLDHESLEWHAGVAHMVRRAEALLTQGGFTTKLGPHDFENRAETSKVLVRLAREEDMLALHVVDHSLAALAQGLHAMALICYPTVVTMGGAMMANEWLLERLREHVQQRSTGIRRTSLRPEMIKRGVLGNDAGMIGAAILAQQANN